MTQPPSYHCFVLDLDGTLVDTAPDIARAANRTLAALGFDMLPDATVASFIGGGIPKLLERCLGDATDRYLDEALPIYMTLYTAEPAATSSVYPGVVETMRQIRDAGAVMGVCTQKDEPLSQAILDQLGLAEFVDCVVGPESVTHRKPHPEPVLRALELLDVAPTDAIFVGDAATDIRAARAAGVASCAVTFGYGSAESLRAEDPTFVVDRFGELLEHVAIR